LPTAAVVDDSRVVLPNGSEESAHLVFSIAPTERQPTLCARSLSTDAVRNGAR
jgi:hypothetical protein